MRTYVAEIGEIVRAQRRDEETVDEIEGRVNSILQKCMSHRDWMQSLPYLNAASKTLYYTATLLSGSQTLGEEYVRLLESVAPHPNTPSWLRRALFVFLHAYAPLIVDRTLMNAERHLQSPSCTHFLGIDVRRNRVARESFLRMISWLRTSFAPNLRRLHIALFYIFGAYYSLSRRMAGIRFVSFSPQSDLKARSWFYSLNALKVYRWLGMVSLAEAAVSVVLWVYVEGNRKKGTTKERREVERKGDEEDDKYPVCALCASSHPPACPPCGHVSCWTCLSQLAADCRSDESPRCPHCRLPFQPQQIVPLLNL